MTKEQFLRQAARLNESKYSSDTFKSTLWHYCQTLDESDLAKIISKCLLSAEARFDFKSEIESVKRNRASIESTRLATATGGACTDQGLEKAVSAFGASSLMEAIQKSKNAYVQEENKKIIEITSRRDGRDD